MSRDGPPPAKRRRGVGGNTLTENDTIDELRNEVADLKPRVALLEQSITSLVSNITTLNATSSARHSAVKDTLDIVLETVRQLRNNDVHLPTPAQASADDIDLDAGGKNVSRLHQTTNANITATTRNQSPCVNDINTSSDPPNPTNSAKNAPAIQISHLNSLREQTSSRFLNAPIPASTPALRAPDARNRFPSNFGDLVSRFLSLQIIYACQTLQHQRCRLSQQPLAWIRFTWATTSTVTVSCRTGDRGNTSKYVGRCRTA